MKLFKIVAVLSFVASAAQADDTDMAAMTAEVKKHQVNTCGSLKDAMVASLVAKRQGIPTTLILAVATSKLGGVTGTARDILLDPLERMDRGEFDTMSDTAILEDVYDTCVSATNAMIGDMVLQNLTGGN